MPPTPEFSVIVPTYRRPALLARLLEALRSQDFPRKLYSVIVVNDGSHDADYAAVARRYQSIARYVRCARRRGPAAARNAAAMAAGSPWLVFTDDDCVPPRDWLANLRGHLLRHPETDVLGGPVLPLESTPLGLVGSYQHELRFLKPEVSGREILHMPTANLAVRRSWFDRMEGFDERFTRAGGEDVDLTSRLRESGAALAFSESWPNRHDHNAAGPEFFRRHFRYGYGMALHARHRNEPQARSVSLRGACKFLEAGSSSRHSKFRRLGFMILDLLRQAAYQGGGLWARASRGSDGRRFF